jgi:hypothetical protein
LYLSSLLLLLLLLLLLTVHAVYQLEAPDCSGTAKPFEKPWLQTALMFVAMALCLPIAWIQQKWQARHQQHQHNDVGTMQGHNQHDVEAQSDSGGSRAAAAAAVAKAAAVSASADAPAGATATEQDLRQPLLDRRQQQHGRNTDHNGSGRGGSGGSGGRKRMSKFHEALLLCVPTGFDLAATTLMNVGLLYVAASGQLICREHSPSCKLLTKYLACEEYY